MNLSAVPGSIATWWPWDGDAEFLLGLPSELFRQPTTSLGTIQHLPNRRTCSGRGGMTRGAARRKQLHLIYGGQARLIRAGPCTPKSAKQARR
jgi:hypothetical protein